jgi:hypothetical protein
MYSFTNTGYNNLINTNVALVLGTGPSQTPTPMYLIQNLAAGGTVTLPKINQVPPTAPGTPGTTPGISDGYTLLIKNIAQFPTTITPASGDTCDVALISNSGDAVWLEADAANSVWRAITPGGAATGITTAAGATTLSPNTRYLILSAAATVTIPTTLGIGRPYTIINESTGSLTLTPVSGTVDTTASFTLTTLKSFTVFTDGTNFHAINTQ